MFRKGDKIKCIDSIKDLKNELTIGKVYEVLEYINYTKLVPIVKIKGDSSRKFFYPIYFFKFHKAFSQSKDDKRLLRQFYKKFHITDKTLKQKEKK